jgi:pilus assembly protein CpaB
MRLFLLAIAIASGLGALWLWFADPMQPLVKSALSPGGSYTPDAGSVQSEVAVLIANSDLPLGTMLTAEQLGWATVATAELPPGAILQAVQPDADQRMLGMFALRDVSAGSSLSWADLAGSDDSGLSFGIAPDHFALTVVVSEATGVAGLVEPGDRIDLVRTRLDAANAERVFEIVARDIKILAVDQRLERSATEAARPSRTLTLELSEAFIEKVTLAQAEGGVTVVLRPRAVSEPKPSEQ